MSGPPPKLPKAGAMTIAGGWAPPPGTDPDTGRPAKASNVPRKRPQSAFSTGFKKSPAARAKAEREKAPLPIAPGDHIGPRTGARSGLPHTNRARPMSVAGEPEQVRARVQCDHEWLSDLCALLEGRNIQRCHLCNGTRPTPPDEDDRDSGE